MTVQWGLERDLLLKALHTKGVNQRQTLDCILLCSPSTRMMLSCWDILEVLPGLTCYKWLFFTFCHMAILYCLGCTQIQRGNYSSASKRWTRKEFTGMCLSCNLWSTGWISLQQFLNDLPMVMFNIVISSLTLICSLNRRLVCWGACTTPYKCISCREDQWGR